MQYGQAQVCHSTMSSLRPLPNGRDATARVHGALAVAGPPGGAGLARLDRARAAGAPGSPERRIDLFTQPGAGGPPLTHADVLGPSEAMRAHLDYFSHTPRAPELLDRLASLRPSMLACMHGSAWEGDGAALLRALAQVLGREARPSLGENEQHA
jgi:hypothetical protein